MKNISKKILIVDDDRIHLFTTQKLILLSQKNVQLKSYRDGKEAFLYLLKNSENINELPDVILLDIVMPGWNGWKFLEAFEKLVHHYPKPVKLYILSTSMNPVDVGQANAHPLVEEYIQKPLTVDMLSRVFERNLVK